MYRGSLTTRRLFLQRFVAKKSTATSSQGVIDPQSNENSEKCSESENFQRSPDTTYAASRRGSFFQEAPKLRNQYNGDLLLQSYLRRTLPNEVEKL